MTEFKLDFEGEEVSKKKLKKIWRSITPKPFPYGKIRAWIIADKDAQRVFGEVDKSLGHETIAEYGKDEPADEKTGAGIFVEKLPDGSNGFLILIKEHSFTTIEEHLKHELNHIANDEIKLDGSLFGVKYNEERTR